MSRLHHPSRIAPGTHVLRLPGHQQQPTNPSMSAQAIVPDTGSAKMTARVLRCFLFTSENRSACDICKQAGFSTIYARVMGRLARSSSFTGSQPLVRPRPNTVHVGLGVSLRRVAEDTCVLAWHLLGQQAGRANRSDQWKARVPARDLRVSGPRAFDPVPWRTCRHGSGYTAG